MRKLFVVKGIFIIGGKGGVKCSKMVLQFFELFGKKNHLF
jgi:hypothetical protein